MRMHECNRQSKKKSSEVLKSSHWQRHQPQPGIAHWRRQHILFNLRSVFFLFNYRKWTETENLCLFSQDIPGLLSFALLSNANADKMHLYFFTIKKTDFFFLFLKVLVHLQSHEGICGLWTKMSLTDTLAT